MIPLSVNQFCQEPHGSRRSKVWNEDGIALPLSLFVLVALMLMVLTFLSVGAMEPQAASNLTDASRARYAAEAGLEWAFDQLASAPAAGPTSWNGLLATNNGQMAISMPLAGLPATSGTYSVTIRNDTQATDPQITGKLVDPGGAMNDTNGVIIVNSMGTYNGVTRQIQQVVTRLNLQIPGSVNLYGFGTNTIFNGNSFTITGNDTNPDGTAGSCAPAWGITGADVFTEQVVQASLSPQQKDNVTGKPQAAGPGVGDNTIAPDSSLAPDKIAKFANAVKPYANLSLESSGGSLSYKSVGDTCAANWNDTNCWGTPSNPKIVYVSGSLDPKSWYSLTVSGTSTGAGVLIVENGDMSITGNFNWQGLILITGQYAGLRYGGGGNQAIYGGVVVNETALKNLEVEFDASGNAKVFYSCQALTAATSARGLTRVTSWREF